MLFEIFNDKKIFKCWLVTESFKIFFVNFIYIVYIFYVLVNSCILYEWYLKFEFIMYKRIVNLFYKDVFYNYYIILNGFN